MPDFPDPPVAPDTETAMSAPGTLIDISQSLRPGMPVWPGDAPYRARWTCTLEGDCPVNVSEVTLSTHTGAHADAPLHYDPAGRSIDRLDLAPFIGPARVIDVRGARGDEIDVGDVTPALDAGVTRVLLRQFDRFPHDDWNSGFKGVTPAMIGALAARGVVLIGMDAPSIDPESSKTLDAHQAVRAADMRVLEGLVLERAAPGDYELIAPPLKLAGLDGAPVRAVLRMP